MLPLLCGGQRTTLVVFHTLSHFAWVLETKLGSSCFCRKLLCLLSYLASSALIFVYMLSSRFILETSIRHLDSE